MLMTALDDGDRKDHKVLNLDRTEWEREENVLQWDGWFNIK